MALAPQIRAAVSAAKLAVDDLLVSIEHEAYASIDADGKRSYDPAVTRKAFETTQVKSIFRQTGIEAVPGRTFLFLENVDFDVKDRITLPDGTQPTIIEIEGVNDPLGGRYYSQITCGRPDRGAVT